MKFNKSQLGAQSGRRAFTLIELLVVIAIIAILAGMLLPAVTRAKEMGKRIHCINNVKNLSLSCQMYLDDNEGKFPKRGDTKNVWPIAFYDSYQTIKILRCPSDGLNPAAYVGGVPAHPANSAPRSYIINGWNDYFSDPAAEKVMPESAIQIPTDTIVFGEKATDSGHWWMDYDQLDDDLQLEQTRHAAGTTGSKGGGSVYGFADGGARFFKFGLTVRPVNLWAVTEPARHPPE